MSPQGDEGDAADGQDGLDTTQPHASQAPVAAWAFLLGVPISLELGGDEGYGDNYGRFQKHGGVSSIRREV